MSLNFNGIFKTLNHDDFKENLSKVSDDFQSLQAAGGYF